MATVRTTTDGFKVTDWSDEINNIDRKYNFFTGMGIFSDNFKATTTISFDKDMNDLTLLPDSSRRERNASKGKERKVETFVLPLGYFKHDDAITPEDLQDVKMAGTANDVETWANIRAKKLEDMRWRVMLTHEYMMMKAAQGSCVTPEGTVLADMFSEFGVSQDTVDFQLDSSTTDVDAKISEVKNLVQKNLLTGSLAGRIQIVVGRGFFNALRNHANIRQSYLHYQNSGRQRLRDDLAQYFDWGITETFEHNGVEFIVYDATFKLPDGSTEVSTTDNEGYTVLPTARDMYRAYYGPANKLSLANMLGRKMFAFEYTDPRDEFYDMSVETSPLFIPTQPKAIVKVTTTLP